MAMMGMLPAPLMGQAADGLGCLVAVHHRHLCIHEDRGQGITVGQELVTASLPLTAHSTVISAMASSSTAISRLTHYPHQQHVMPCQFGTL